jgi:hypothetical protein
MKNGNMPASMPGGSGTMLASYLIGTLRWLLITAKMRKILKTRFAERKGI